MAHPTRTVSASAVALVAVALLAACASSTHTAVPSITTGATTTVAAATTRTSSPARTPASTVLPTTTARPATTSSVARVALSPPTSPPVTAAPVAAPAAVAPCPADRAGRLASTGTATPLIGGEAPTARTQSATLTLWQRLGTCWSPVAGPWPARIGVNGFSDHHVEGDLTTPTGAYGIGPVMYGNAPDPGVHYAYHRLTCGDWWDEDPSSAAYNTFQELACGEAPPFGGGSERLWQETVAYPSFAVVDYNTHPTVAGAGSAIFIHADTGGATAGCVSVPLGDLDTLLRWLRPAASPLIVMGPDAELPRF